MKKKSQKITIERIEMYRTYTTPDVFTQISELNTCSIHHDFMLDLGSLDIAQGAERAWLEDSVILAATSALTPQQANLKITYLQACLDTWVIQGARAKGHVNIAGMLLTAVRAETDKWGAGTGDQTARPN